MIKKELFVTVIMVICFSLTACSSNSSYYGDTWSVYEYADIAKDRIDELENDVDELEDTISSLKETIEYYERFLNGVYYYSLEDNYVHKLDCFNIQDDSFLAVNETELEEYEKCPNCFGDDKYYYDCVDSPGYYTNDISKNLEMITKNNLVAFYLERGDDEEAEELVFVQPNDSRYHKLICDELTTPNAWTRITASERGYTKCDICFKEQ